MRRSYGPLARDRPDRLPDVAGPQLLELAGGRAPGAVELIASLDPDSVVLAGPETWWLPAGLRSIGASSRMVSVPLLGDDPIGHLPQLRPLLQEVDGLGVLSRGEARLAGLPTDAPDRTPASRPPEVTELDVALAVDRSSAESKLFEMAGFGPYVVLMTGYPAGSPGAQRTPGHDYVRALLGPIAVAEVAFDRWSVSDGETTLELTAAPTRVNLWRLLRHAEVCVDLRPSGIVGRETIEALLLGTPVVVPEGTTAAEHAERSNGGLWYRDYHELFDAAKAILDDPSLRAGLGRQGREWAAAVHGDQGRFCEQAARLVLG